jgi:hypothetical protein
MATGKSEDNIAGLILIISLPWLYLKGISTGESECAEKTWRKQRGFAYLAKVITGVKFEDGVEVTADNQAAS